ncbi:GNAT family N-acetyltransferase [Paracoccus niistensis]|uniref:GNAT family N-acetyltransferase n=1 Tax=Paracoccus niistensis TaxID=632935 RepID=A0ABV6I409_9RHOB
MSGGPAMGPVQLAALHDRCFVTPRPWTAAEFDGLLSAPGCVLLTAAGSFLLGRVAGGEAELLTLAVAPEARCAGLGRALVGSFLEQCKAQGAEAAFLEVASDNAPALALYRRTGWAAVGRRPRYYAPGIDAVVMRHGLGPAA